MACSMDALRWSSCCSRVHIHIVKESKAFLITQSISSRFGGFSDIELRDTGQLRSAKSLSYSCKPRILKLTLNPKSRRVYCVYDGVGDVRENSRSEALSVVVKSLIAAGIDAEDAERISLNCPLFIQKLVGRSIEADEIVRWANSSTEAEDEGSSTHGVDEVVELNVPERWSAMLEFVGVQAQAATRISHVLSNSSLPEFLKKVGTLCDWCMISCNCVWSTPTVVRKSYNLQIWIITTST